MSKTSVLILLSLIISINVFGQKKKEVSTFECYLPSGLKCKDLSPKDNTIHKISLHFEPKGRIWTASSDLDKSIIIVFKSYTKEPLFIVSINKKPYSADRIRDFIFSVNPENSSYNYYFGKHDYGNHWGVKANTRTFIEKKILDEEFLTKNLGSPAEIKESVYDGEPAKCLVYLIEGMRVYFVNGMAVGMEEL